MPPHHDRLPPPATERPRPPSAPGHRAPPPRRPHHGVTATVSAVLRHDRGVLAAATVRVVGLSALARLLMTALIFALSWPLFTRMRNRRAWYHHLEDPYLHDHTALARLALGTLPLHLLLLGTGSAALQTVCSRAVAAKTQPLHKDRPPPAALSRLRPVLAVYTLRGLIVRPLPLLAAYTATSLTGHQLDTPEPLERGSLPCHLVAASPAAALFVAVLLRLAFALTPAAAATGLGPRAALRRSWSLTRTRAGATRALDLALPPAALCAALLRLATQLALPLRPLVRTLLEQATGNFFAAYYAGILAPVTVGIPATAATTLPLTCTAFAALRDHLRPSRTSPRDPGGPAAASTA
ncbi:hypothetical protein ME763_36805 (plasmid) [Streptomyces murinus]|uniref:hypothetical protein n=1 Tax=Streptomyces murinus TaxID=33900 RepID=UPI002379DF1D|nr:hypothetical protein [Streptomyces murinus]WDO11300.1 hypothetical protein ME763_36805 [Streptomyces murinus]